jgi:serine/threonine protein kinase
MLSWEISNLGIDTDHAEGIYLRKYLPLSEVQTPTQPKHILRYQDIIRALQHLHDLGISHLDIRIDNILFDHHSRALICNFGTSSPFDQPNPAHPDEWSFTVCIGCHRSVCSGITYALKRSRNEVKGTTTPVRAVRTKARGGHRVPNRAKKSLD